MVPPISSYAQRIALARAGRHGTGLPGVLSGIRKMGQRGGDHSRPVALCWTTGVRVLPAGLGPWNASTLSEAPRRKSRNIGASRRFR